MTENAQMAMVVGGAAALVAMFIMIGVSIFVEQRRKLAETREREQTKREVAAYVAEGTITPDDAARILSAGAGGGVAETIRRAFGGGGGWGARPEPRGEPHGAGARASAMGGEAA